MADDTLSLVEPPEREPVTDTVLLALLARIKELALSKYPFMQEEATLDHELCMTLGVIAGICSQQIELHLAKQPPPGFV